MDAGAARDRRACPINRYLDQQKAGDAIAAAFKMKYPDAKPDQIDAERGGLRAHRLSWRWSAAPDRM